MGWALALNLNTTYEATLLGVIIDASLKSYWTTRVIDKSFEQEVVLDQIKTAKVILISTKRVLRLLLAILLLTTITI